MATLTGRASRRLIGGAAALTLIGAGSAVVTAAGPAPASTAAEPVMGGHITVSGEAEVANAWTPAAMQCDSYCYVRARTFFDTIAAIDDDGEPVPMLAESFTPNDDYSEWTVKLREGISFTDGTPFNAEAAVYNLQVAGTSLLLAAALGDIAKVPSADDPSKMELKIEIADEYTFTVYLGKDGDPEQPRTWPRFPAAFSTQWGMMASMEWLQAVAGDPSLAATPVGTGPFMVESYSPRESLDVVRNPDYWMTDAAGNQLPYLDGITFRVIEDSEVAAEALQAGDIDLLTTSGARAIADFQEMTDDYSVNMQEEQGETNYILLDLDKVGPLQDQRVRCALSLAIDRQELIDATAAGILEPANGLFSPGQQGYLEDNGLPIEQDLEAASALIAEYEEETGEDVTINLGHTPPNSVVQSAELIMGYWNEIGVDVTDQTVPQSDFITLALFGDPAFEAFLWRNHAGALVSDQYFWWHSTNAAPDGQLALNFSRIRDEDIDAGLEAARGALTPEEGQAAAEQVNRAFAENCYEIPLSWTKWAIISAPEIQGYGDLRIEGSEQPLRQAAGQFWVHTLSLAEG